MWSVGFGAVRFFRGAKSSSVKLAVVGMERRGSRG